MNAATLRARWMVSALALVGWCATTAMAVSPLKSLVPYDSSYVLTENNGPWLIMATTFEGPKAEEDARRLVTELRKSYKLTAYTHQMTFDFSGTMTGKGFNRTGGQNVMKYRRAGKLGEVAVLVGDFASFDDPRATKALEQIKIIRPAALADADASAKSQLESAGGNTQAQQPESTGSRTFAALRDKMLPASSNQKKKGPMRLAFITTNPLIPESYFQPKGVDRLVVEMNEGVEHSLLDNPGRYTVKVATFSGNVVIDPRRIQEIKNSDGPDARKSGDFQNLGVMNGRLEKAALKAHDVTVFLRAKGYEAYEFHDRHSSIVAVGGFASPGATQPDGSLKYSPEVQQVVDVFKAQPAHLPNGSLGPVTPQQVTSLHICFDPQPLVIEVPKRSYGADYAGGATRSR